MTDIRDGESVNAEAPRLIFRAGEKRCSLPVSEVERIVSASAFELYTIPLADERAVGLLSLDGQPALVLRFPDVQSDETLSADSSYIVMSVGGERFCFLADAVLTVESGSPAKDELALNGAVLLETVTGNEKV